MNRLPNPAAGNLVLSWLRRANAPVADMRLQAVSLGCAALACGLASFGDLRAGAYLPGLIGWLLVARLLQRVTHSLTHPQGPENVDWITPALGTAWVFLFLLVNEVRGFYWCLPVLLAITLHVPSPVAGAVAGALCVIAALAAYPASGMEAAAAAAFVLASTAAVGCMAAGRLVSPAPAGMADAITRWGSAASLYWEADGNATTYSTSFKTMLGYSPGKDHTPFNFFDLVHPDDRAGLERIFRAELRLARTGSPLKGRAAQVRLMARDGTWRWVLADIVALFVSRSTVSQCICSFVDVTSHVVAQEALAATRRTLQAQSVELLEARAGLRESGLAQQELHSRVPLAWEGPARAADDALAMLEESATLHAAAAGAIAQARAHLGEASRRTQWIIQLALMEQSQWHPPRAAFELAGMAAEAAGRVRPLAQARGVVLEPGLRGKSVPAMGHEHFCCMALEALVRDAVQSATAGSIVSLAVAARAGRVGVEIRRTDALPADQRSTYFDPPLPAGGIPPVSPYAARLIVRAQGGDVVLGAPSRYGMSLLFMLEEVSMEASPSHHESVLDVLVAGGSACRRSVVAACAGLAVDVRHAPDGPAAIDAVIQRRPDVIVVDAADGLDGFMEGFLSIRAMQRDAAEPPSLWIAMGPTDGTQEAAFSHRLAGPAAWRDLSGLLRAARADKQAGASAVHVDPSVLKAVPQYVESRKRLAADLREALQAGHRVEAARIAHLLGGSPGLRGFGQAVQACRAIGDLDSSEPVESLLARMDEVDAALQRLQT